MKNKFLLFTWLLAVPLLWGGCEKPLFQPNKDDTEEPEELPPITTTGENTSGCLVNGEVWLPAGPDRYNRGVDENTGQFIFTASKARYQNDGIYEIVGLNGTVSVSSRVTKNFFLSCGTISETLFTGYRMDSVFDNSLEFLRIDTEANIASGTFHFTAVNRYAHYDTVRITQRRFDFNY